MKQLSRQVMEELKQKQSITDNLINKILYSKRLLVDHVEALEHCMLHLGNARITSDQTDGVSDASANSRIAPRKHVEEIFTARNTCLLLGGTILEHLITPKSLRFTLLPSVLLTGGFSVMYAIRNVFVFRNKIVERELDNLIRTIDEFGNCIRRNMTYFNEIIIMKQQELIESRQIERAWDCITAAKEVTEILYDATRKLETLYPIPAKFTQYYAPMEELRECEYFKNNVTDYSPKHIKDFHNIFAYVQSQFLLRLALTISTKPSISQLNAELVKIDCLIRQLVQEEENHFKNLAIQLKKKKQIEIETLNAAKVMQNRSGPIAVLQDSSLKLSARMVAVAGECQGLDITLQRLTETEADHKDNAKHLVLVANNMRSIENALSVCFDDFQRLILMYSKFLSSKLKMDDGQNEKNEHNSDCSPSEYPESILRVEISQNHDDSAKKDDFYAYMFDEQHAAEEEQAKRESQNQTAPDVEILNFEKRVTKGKFRPVLKQLKDRIDPIRLVMLQKEREVLTAKGINVDELFKRGDEDEKEVETTAESNISTMDDHNDINAGQEDSDSDGSADLEFQRRAKILKERDNFAEMRNFLAQKQAINIFKLDLPTTQAPPVNATGAEEILESEC